MQRAWSLRDRGLGAGPKRWGPEPKTMPHHTLSSQATPRNCRNRGRFAFDPRAVGRWRPVIASWKSPRRTRRDGWLRRTRSAVRSRGPGLPAWALACMLGVGLGAMDLRAQEAAPDLNQAKANMLW